MEKVKKKKKTYKNNESFKLQIIEENTDKLHESLGITSNRMSEINILVKSNYAAGLNLSKALEVTIDELNHINEVVYATLLMGRYHDSFEVMGILGRIKDSL